jgi:hypothetical protein
MKEIRTMNVTTVQNMAQSLSQSSTTRNKAQVDFKATLAAANQNLSQTSKNTTQEKSTEDTQTTASYTGKTAAQELEEYLKKSPAEHMRDAILKEMGLTEDDLAAMPPEQRKAIEDTIAAKIKDKLLEHSDVAKNAANKPLSTQSLLTTNMA